MQNKNYKYSVLLSSYFSQFEKIWIEGYCKENRIELTEANLPDTLSKIVSENKGPKSVLNKADYLLKESIKFSCYVKDTFIKTWDNILGYAMNTVETNRQLNEVQIADIKKGAGWWLKIAPKTLAEHLSRGYFVNIILECVSGNADILSELASFDPRKGHPIVERIKGTSPIKKYTEVAVFECKFSAKDVLKNEPFLNMVPDAERILAMISWTSESVKICSPPPNK